MIKFLFKMMMVFCIAIAAVVYHNTDSGKEMEDRVGKALEFRSLKERGKALISKTIHFISLDGMDEDSVKDELNKVKKVKKDSAPLMKKAAELKEKMPEDERKRIEKIIEEEG